MVNAGELSPTPIEEFCVTLLLINTLGVCVYARMGILHFRALWGKFCGTSLPALKEPGTWPHNAVGKWLKNSPSGFLRVLQAGQSACPRSLSPKQLDQAVNSQSCNFRTQYIVGGCKRGTVILPHPRLYGTLRPKVRMPDNGALLWTAGSRQGRVGELWTACTLHFPSLCLPAHKQWKNSQILGQHLRINPFS